MMSITVDLTSKEYGDHVVVVHFPTHQMLIDTRDLKTEDGRALLAMAIEIYAMQRQLAYQAAAPIDNVAEALEKAAKLVDALIARTDMPTINDPDVLEELAKDIRALIPTQAKKGE
jgi:hypothetical protein